MSPTSKLEDMPFKSLAQRRKFYELVKQGKMAPDTLREWEEATKIQGKKLPEYFQKEPQIRKVKPLKKI